MKRWSKTLLAFAMAVCLCVMPVHAQSVVSGSTVLDTYHTLIDAYNNFAVVHEEYLSTLGSAPTPDSVRAYDTGALITLNNLYAARSAQNYFSTLDGGTLTEINNILSEDIQFISGAAAYISSLYTNSYPAGDYTPGSIYGPSLTQAELDQVAVEVSRFAAGLPLAQMSDTDKVIAAHDFLVQFCTYAPDWSQNRANTAWGALVYGEAQCSGYARAMKALCDAMGVECYYVHASDQADNPDHQWNVVKIDGQYYIIDVQANASSGISASSGLLTSTLLVSDDTYAALGPAWDRASVPACPVNYTGPIYDYIFFQRLDGSYFGARMIY